MVAAGTWKHELRCQESASEGSFFKISGGPPPPQVKVSECVAPYFSHL
jgi:hypothetical protein